MTYTNISARLSVVDGEQARKFALGCPGKYPDKAKVIQGYLVESEQAAPRHRAIPHNRGKYANHVIGVGTLKHSTRTGRQYQASFVAIRPDIFGGYTYLHPSRGFDGVIVVTRIVPSGMP